ncbi:MAG TPA: ABC transporter permease subunit [Chthonomonadaceae bacterium]|nr:ABC transporter permease subunit [Chthonomonadaceae bacterium]
MRFSIRSKLSPRADFLIGLSGIVALILIWCILTYGGFVKPLFLPTPTGIWDGLMEFQSNPNHPPWVFPAIWRSFWRVTRSLGWVILVGVPIGVLMGAFSPIDAFLRKIVNGGKSIPTTGIVGLIVLWFSIEERAKIVFLFLGAIFYMIILVKNAILSVSEDYVRVALDIGANRWQMIWRVLLPGALPQIWDAIAVCNGIMWTYIVLAEFINSNEEQLGLGYLLYLGSRTQESGKVFGVLILIALISSLTDWALQTVRKRYLNW